MIILFQPRRHLIFFLLLLSATLARAFQTTQNSLSQTLSISPSQNRPSHQPRNFIFAHSEELQSPNNRRVAARVRSSQSDEVTPPSASTLTATPTTAWKSCPQPRFDEFASSIIGPWTVISSSSTASPFPPTSTPTSSSSFTKNKRYEVEEVMRSCGGAVQGIREFPLSCIFPEVAIDDDGAMAEERTYHNRADGGFVYFDDGSYSAGLERWDWGSMMEDEGATTGLKRYPKLMMASLAFPNRRRVWVTATMSELSSAASAVVGEGAKGRIEGVACTAMDLVRPTSTSKESERAEKSDTIEDSIVSALPPSIRWKRIQRVRMSSASQSWSLPRAKWECKVESSEGEGSSNDATKSHLIADLGESTMDCWAFVECMPEDDGIFGDMIADDGHVNMHMVAVCSTSNMARSVVRHYDTSGMLKSVAFLDGILVLNEDE